MPVCCDYISLNGIRSYFLFFFRGQKVGGLRDTPSHGEIHMPNPFSDRPSTARQRTVAQQHLESALQELDKEANMPEGVDPFVWDRMCLQRRQKIESELMVRS